MTSTQNILVVDDDPDLLQAMSRLLTRAGYGVIEAGTATEALRLAREQRPDLALVDLLLPDFDGITLSRRFQTDPALAGGKISRRVRQSGTLVTQMARWVLWRLVCPSRPLLNGN